MTQAAVARLLEEVKRLTKPEHLELTDRLVENPGHDIPEEVGKAQLEEVRRRIAEVEAGEVALIPGDEALAQVRRLLTEAGAAN